MEAGDEWTSVLVPRGDPEGAIVRGEPAPTSLFAALLAIFGSVLLGLGWTGLSSIPEEEASGARWPHWTTGAVGALGCALAFVLGWSHLVGAVAAPMFFATVGGTAAALGRLGARGYPGRSWLVLIARLLFLMALALVLGFVVPTPWRGALIACAPFAVTLTLPLQARLWPAIELALDDRAQRADRRARLRRAMQGLGSEMIVRVDSVDSHTACVTRRCDDGDVSLRAASGVLARARTDKGPWYLLVGPVIEQRPSPSGGDYRTATHEVWIASVDRAEGLGADIDRALRVDATASVRIVECLAVALACVAIPLVGAVMLRDAWPPMTGDPIPPTGLVERLDVAVVRMGRVEEVVGWSGVSAGASCVVHVEPTHRTGQTCHLRVDCGTLELYPGNGAGYARCVSSAVGAVVGEDTSMTDGDPAVRVDTRTGKVVVRRSSEARISIALDR
jgi:hypothetical protein